MAASRWIFTKEQLANTPSRKSGIDADKELSYRQQAATLIQDMGQRLSVTQLCINTAIVYMHRYYMFQTFARFPRNDMAPACLFLAAKVEEQPRKLEHVIKVAHSCLHRDNTPAPDVKSEAYLEQAQTLVINENVLLQTLGFDVTVDHPHTNVVKLTQLVKGERYRTTMVLLYSIRNSQRRYPYLTHVLHMTTFCLQYRPTVVACVCIYLACKWSNWKIPKSNEGKEWFQYIDRSVTQEMLDERYKEFLDILEKYPHKLRKKIMGWKGEKTEGITKADLEPSPSPSGSSGSRHEHRRETSSDHRRDHDRKEVHKHEGSSKRESSHQSENKDRLDPNDLRFGKHGPSDRKEGHLGDRREQSHSHNRDVKYRDMRDGSEHRHMPSDRKLIPHTKPPGETTGENRSQTNINHTGNPKPSVSDNTGNNSANKHGSEKDTSAIPNTGQSQPNTTSEMHRSKSETTLNYKDYLKRKEQEKIEKMERERLEREKIEKGRMLNLKMLSESESLNKSFSETSARPEKREMIVKPEKNRPPKLNISSNHPDRSHHGSKGNERPYEVNIKSPIKPHHNIKVKSPIKSSDLKQPKLEITKVQITPEKDGSDPFSVNINEDPNLKKMVENIKKEPGANPTETRTESSEGNLSFTNHDRTASPRVKVKHESTSPRVRTKPETAGSPRVKLKNESSETPTKVKQEKTAVDSPVTDIQLLPEHTVAPNFKIKELNYDPDRISDSPTSLKLSNKYDSGSGRNTPIISQLKSEPGSGASPLKLKIITKGLKPDGDQSSGSSHHGSPHGKHHKHKHKSHKHSKDKHREKHEHRDKHGTNGHPLKMSIKLSNIPGSDSRHKHEKNKLSISDTSLNKNPNAGEFGERQQPWSMSDLMSQSGGNPESSRKRRRTPTVDQSVDVSSHSKQAKVDSHRLRRSSSSHSVISMELSDGDADDRTSNGQDKLDQPKVVNQLLESLQQAIDQTKRNNEVALKQHKIRHNTSMNSQSSSGQVRVDRQQSGFDLEGMMWSGTSDQPPLPSEAPPPLPMSPPPRHIVPPPPPPPQ